MTIQLNNTLSGSKETFHPLDENRITVYLCGPTVYNYAHIGNARPAVVVDVLVRLLRREYPQVVFARNITDIDDKINNSARECGCPINEIAEKYTRAYNEDLKALGVSPPDIEPHATHHVIEIIDMIQTLVDRGNAYVTDNGHVLFDVDSCAEYGRLSKRNRDEMIAGARVEVADYKKNPADFVLWKPSDASLPGWDSPWGRGRPGWHIECSAMACKHLGPVIDIHCGGKDLIFPHHENEIAQSCCANQTAEFARYWVHNGFITLSEQKMSKSLGNILLMRDAIAEYRGEVVRWLLLSAHYRQSLEWSDETIQQARRTLDRIYATLRDCETLPRLPGDHMDDEVLQALRDDLNTPIAFARLNGLAKALANAADDTARAQLKSTLLDSAALLGVLQQSPQAWFAQDDVDADLKQRVEALIAARDAARKQRDWAESDRLRDELNDLGVLLEDGAEGTRWKMK